LPCPFPFPLHNSCIPYTFGFSLCY
jgi:hypothetical protein